MAKKPAGYYSPEAIQARQQVVVDEYNRQQEAKKKQEAAPRVERPTPTQTPTGTPSGSTSASTGGNFNLPVVQQGNPTVPNALPFMAQGNANITTIFGKEGVEPIYYTGRPQEGWRGTIDALFLNPFKNWARRTYAAINNPTNFISAPTPEQKAEIEARVKKYKSEPYHTYHNYGENATGQTISAEEGYAAIGFDVEEVFTAKATQEVAKETGDVNVGFTKATKTVKETAKSVAFGVLGAPEWVVRNGASVLKTIDDVADTVAGEDRERVDQYIDVNGIEKFNKAVMESKATEVWKRIPALNLLQNYDFLNVVRAMTPYEFFKDAGRLVVNLDKVKPGQFTEQLNMNLAGSQMIYSMFRDATVAAEYERRYKAGESPQMLVAELQDAGTELVGGILYDPTTWIGGGMVDDAGKQIVKSATRANIEDALADTRISRPVAEAIETIVKDTKKVQNKDEILKGIRGAFETTAEQFNIWRNKRGVSQLTSSGKQSLVIEQMNDVFRSLSARASTMADGMDELLKTVHSMKTLAKGEGNMEEAFLQLAKTPLGQMPLSPRGMRAAHLISSLDDSAGKFAKAIEDGDVKVLANLYAEAVEGAVKKTILSVDEMAQAAEKMNFLKSAPDFRKLLDEAQSLIGKTDDASKKLLATKENELKELAKASDINYSSDLLRISKEYDELPAVVKFVNGANNLGQKTWMAPMKFFAETYFGLNRFAYPIRNVLGTIPGMTYEFGLTDAVEMATKSIVGSQVESIGNKALKGYVDEIGSILGYVPEAVTRGGIPTEGFVDVSKKYTGILGLFKVRGGSQVAQLSEQLMSAQIMLKSIQREVKTALKHGALPDVSNLARVGLDASDVKVLLNYAYEHRGNDSKILSAFRQYMNTGEDVARNIPLPEKLDEFLEYIGKGSENLKKEFSQLLNNAKTKAEVEEGMASIWKKAEAAGELSRTEKTQLSDALLQEVGDDIKEAQRLKTASPEALDDFERVVQSFENAKLRMIDAEEVLKKHFYKYADIPEENGKIFASLRAGAEKATPDVDAVRRLVNEIRNDKSLTPSDMYKMLEDSNMPLSKLTDVDPSKLTRRQMDRIMWDSFFFWRSKKYAERITNYIAGVSATFEKMSEQIGKTLPDVAKETGVPWQEVRKAYDDAMKYYDEAAIDTMSFSRAKVPTGTTLKDLEMSGEELLQYGYRSRTHLFNSINKYRRDHGLSEYADFGQVDMWEVQDAIRRFRRNQGFIPTPKNESVLGSINEEARAADAAAITETDFFKKLKEQARAARDAKAGSKNIDAAVSQVEPQVVQKVTNVSVPTETKFSTNIDEAKRIQDVEELKGTPAYQAALEVKKRRDARRLLEEQGYKQIKHPPIAPDKPVTPSRMIQEQLPDAKADFDNYVAAITSKWGEIASPKSRMTDEIETALADWANSLRRNMSDVYSEAGTIATATRDAMLYDYRKQLWQVAAQYVSPFSYYHVSASKQWLRNVAADPKWGAIYVDYKEYMSQKYAGLPDFWKQNIAVSGLPGMDKENPLFFNIEASVNPLYQMIGVDYNNPDRRKDWLSSTMDDLSKTIPGLYQPLQWLTAANLYAKGEKEAGDLWLGRLIPQTKIIKTVSNAFGISIPGTKYNELDPFVGLIMDGLDSFEEKRALRYLSTMPGISEEDRIAAAHSRQGEIWDAAVRESLSNRAGAEVASYFLGVGYKPRTTNDVMVDQFYDDYRKLIAARSIMPPDEYRDAWDALREKYSSQGLSMDVMLIGKRAGAERDTAFAYNVLNRIPPGEISDIAETLGVKPYMLQQFYDNKGDLSKMTKADQQRFMGAILDMSAMLKMPNGATREEWNSARETYASMNEALKSRYGADILDKISILYSTPEKDWDAYLKAYPEVEAAMRDKDAYVSNTPILSAYYGSIETIERYHNSQVYIQLEKEFGKDIADIYEQYKAMKFNDEREMQYYEQHNLGAYFEREAALKEESRKQLEAQFGENIYALIDQYNIMKYEDPAGAKVFRRQNLKPYYDAQKDANKAIKAQLQSEFANIDEILAGYNTIKATETADAKQFYRDNNLDAYEARREELFSEADNRIMAQMRNLPEGTGYQIRPEFQPQSGYQQEALQSTQGSEQAQISATAQLIMESLSPAAQSLFMDAMENGEEIPATVERQIRFIAEQNNISPYEAMRLLGIETAR